MPYAAVICVIDPWFETIEQQARDRPNYNLIPVGGYVLLSRVWSSDVCEYEIDDRMRKVRFGKDGYLVEQVDVPPLPNEGQVAFVDAPLKGALNELHPGQRVLITKGQALVETICGESYLCIRHDYCMAVLELNVIEFELEGKKMTCDMNKARESERGQAFLGQNTFTKEFQRLPLDNPSNNT